jgi:23S rRNA pseudouridine1911/1915/1917 synthase
LSGSSSRKRLDRLVKDQLGISWEAARAAIRSGKVKFGDPPVLASDPGTMLRDDTPVVFNQTAPRPHIARRQVIEQEMILHLDHHVIVVNKPSGVVTVPFGDETKEEAKETLDALVREVLAKKAELKGGPRGRAPLGIVHRLDKETSGVLVFARTVEAKQGLSQQFREHTPSRRYFALVHGVVTGKRTIESHLIENRGDGLRGSSKGGRREGQRAVTHIEALESLRGATLIACVLETGRTHQIRIHLSEQGHPVIGDPVYIRHYKGEKIVAPRTMLHAAELGFEHPVTGEALTFSAPPPADFLATHRGLTLRSAAPDS